jgi:hypothetical protein
MTETTTICTGCERTVPSPRINPDFPKYGFVFNYLDLGYYEGFIDCYPDEGDSGDEDKYIVRLCHDCCTTMLNALPGLQKKMLPFMMGGHPSMNDTDFDSPDGTVNTPCCRYAWTTRHDETGSYVYYAKADCSGWDLIRTIK